MLKMFTMREAKEGSEQVMKKVLTSDSCKYEAILEASLSLKKQFKSPDKIFSRLKLQSLLNNALASVKSTSQGSEVLVNYGNCLVQYFGKDEILDSELVQHLKCILMKLQETDEFMSEELITNTWSKFESGTPCYVDAILNLSKKRIERMVLNWIDTESSSQTAFLSKVSASSPKVFQTVSSILCGVLIRTHAHRKVLEMTNLFIESVKRVCKNDKRDFLRLYPKSCSRIVPLLMVSPTIYSGRERNIASEVLSLLFEMFLSDSHKTFILLSHYSQWISAFKAYMQVKEQRLTGSL